MNTYIGSSMAVHDPYDICRWNCKEKRKSWIRSAGSSSLHAVTLGTAFHVGCGSPPACNEFLNYLGEYNSLLK